MHAKFDNHNMPYWLLFAEANVGKWRTTSSKRALLDIGLNSLTLGRAGFLEAMDPTVFLYILLFHRFFFRKKTDAYLSC